MVAVCFMITNKKIIAAGQLNVPRKIRICQLFVYLIKTKIKESNQFWLFAAFFTIFWLTTKIFFVNISAMAKMNEFVYWKKAKTFSATCLHKNKTRHQLIVYKPTATCACFPEKSESYSFCKISNKKLHSILKSQTLSTVLWYPK